MVLVLKPEPMQRTLIVASRGHQKAVIEALHSLRAAHFVDFQETDKGELAGFRIGRPLPGGEAASERLVRIRALVRHLGLEDALAGRVVPVAELESRLDATLDQVEREVNAAVQTREQNRNAAAEGRDLASKLEPLRALPLRLEDYRGYETLAVFVGRAGEKLDAEVAALPHRDHLLVRGDGDVFALFVAKARAGAYQDALFRAGYVELEVPPGEGTPEARLRELQAQREALEARARKAEEDLARLAAQHKDFLLAAEEHLGILVEKAEAPLAFASTDHAFVVDAWVPARDLPTVEQTLLAATGGNVYLQRLESGSAHAHHGHGAHVDRAYNAHDAHHEEDAAPPTKYANPAGVRRFQWFTDLFSTPRYDEIDPTALFAVFFPLFFGFMVGDLGLGIAMVALGWLLVRKLPRVEGMKQLGTAIVLAGIVAAALGGFVFKDALGVPLGVTHHMEDELHHAGIANPTCADLYAHLAEPTWTCIFRGGDAALHYESWAEPLVAKVTDVPTMLLLSVIAALAHLLIGLLLGIRNEAGHGAKHLMAKVGYLVLLLTFFPAVLALLRPDMFADYVGEAGHSALTLHLPLTTGTAYAVAGVGFLAGAVILGWAEGFGGILEIPAMFTAIMSYLRLGAVAIAKGAMAVAFNSFTLVAALQGAGLAIVLGVLGFLLAQVVLLVLGLLSGGIQSLRLNFVEFYTKFYKGGGTPFKPFGRARVATAPSPSTP